MLDGDSALLAGPDGAAPQQVVTINHHTPPAKLKRMLRAPRPRVVAPA